MYKSANTHIYIYICTRTHMHTYKNWFSKRRLWTNKFDCFLSCKQRMFLLWQRLTEAVSYEMRGLDWWYRRSLPILCIHLGTKNPPLTRISLSHRRCCQPGRSPLEEGIWNLGVAAPWSTEVFRGSLRLKLVWGEMKFINNPLKCYELGPFFLDLVASNFH